MIVFHEILFRLWHGLAGRRTLFERVRQLDESHWQDRPALHQQVRRRLVSLMRHAADHVPYYARHVKERRLALTEETTEADVGQMPILTKDTLRSELRSENPARP